ncbi:response regulator [bacterium]|nr:response regulator [bacterium]
MDNIEKKSPLLEALLGLQREFGDRYDFINSLHKVITCRNGSHPIEYLIHCSEGTIVYNANKRKIIERKSDKRETSAEVLSSSDSFCYKYEDDTICLKSAVAAGLPEGLTHFAILAEIMTTFNRAEKEFPRKNITPDFPFSIFIINSAGQIYQHSEDACQQVGIPCTKDADFLSAFSALLDSESFRLLKDSFEAFRPWSSIVRVGKKSFEAILLQLEKSRIFILYKEYTAATETMDVDRRFEVMGHLSSNIAHDFNNILTAISLNINALERNYNQENIQVIKQAILNGERMVSRLMDFARNRPVVINSVSPHLFFRENRKLFESMVKSKGRLYIDVGKKCMNIYADPYKLVQVILNLLSNACDSFKQETGSIKIECFNTSDKAQEVTIKVSDNGCGISSEVLPMIFDPLFTTKKEGSGTGLGLSSSYGMIKNMKGSIRVESSIDFGSSFYIELPSCSMETAEKKLESTKGRYVNKHLSILFVEDEEFIRNPMTLLLERLGHTVHSYGSPLEAMRKFVPREYDILLTDLDLPNLRGDALAKRIRKQDPHIRVIISTGYSEDNIDLKNGNYALLQKPYSLADIKEIL